MVKTRILLAAASALIIWGIFQLPKVVVKNDEKNLNSDSSSAKPSISEVHTMAPKTLLKNIKQLRANYQPGIKNEKNAIFADSLAHLYSEAANYDSAVWFAEEAAAFFNTPESWIKAGDEYYKGYTFAIDPGKQQVWAEKARAFYSKVLKVQPKKLDVKTRMAMTYLSSGTPMQGIQMLREVLADDPQNQEAIFNLGMLSVQSGQYERAVERLEELIRLNPSHVQGRLLLGVALMNTGKKEGARQQFEKVKQLDNDPAVQATVDSYLKDLK
jgi:tetratricopeptide (TPR) repeat protein